MPDAYANTLIEHRALTVTVRTPSVWPHCLRKKILSHLGFHRFHTWNQPSSYRRSTTPPRLFSTPPIPAAGIAFASQKFGEIFGTLAWFIVAILVIVIVLITRVAAIFNCHYYYRYNYFHYHCYYCFYYHYHYYCYRCTYILMDVLEGSLEVTPPTIWANAKAEVGRVREEKKRSEKIRE